MVEPKTSQIPIGATLAGKYRVTREIGRGGMASVYEAENTLIGKRVAVKVLAAELAGSKVVVERFVREARAASSISSPYICDVYDAGKLADGRPFLVLELLEGESLYDRMVRERRMRVEDVVRIVGQVARGLTKAHAAGIVHRDMKPENVFLTHDEDGQLVSKILDFGLAKMYAPVASGGPQARLTREGAIFGTPAYMSPEQINGQGAADHRSDLWALGCIAFELLTGRTVWSTDQGVAMTFAQIASWPLPDPLALRPDLPAAFRAWFERALARRADERFQSAKELADGLAEAFGQPADWRSPASLGRIEAADPVPSWRADPVPSARVEATPPPRAEPLDSTDIEVLEPVKRRPQPVELPAPQVPRVPASRPRPAIPPAPISGRHVLAPPVAALPPPPRIDRPPMITLSAGATSSTVDHHPPSVLPPFRARRSIASWLVGAGVLIAAGVVVATRVLDSGPPRQGTTVVDVAPAAIPQTEIAPAAALHATAPSASAAPATAPAATTAATARWAVLVADAQRKLAAGDAKGAEATLKDAAASAPSTAPRALLEHVQAASRSGGACRLSGLARPRPPDVPGPAVRPVVTWGQNGAIAAWIDDHESPGHAHAWATRLDKSLATVGAPRDLTPEAGDVQHLAIAGTEARLAIAWSDAKAGVLARGIDADGRIATAPVVVAARSAGRREPALEPAPDGSFWIAWEDGKDGAATDLWLRHLAPTLALDGGEIRATDYAGRGGRPRVHGPSLGFSTGVLGVVYGWERGAVRRVALLRVLLDDADLKRGVDESVGAALDRNIGTTSAIVPDEERADDADMACGPQGCFLVWRSAGGSLTAALLDVGDGRLVWRKRFELKGAHPAIGLAPSGAAAVAWTARGRLLFASLGREGVGRPTVLGRAAGDNGRPAVTAGAQAGEWYATWLDFEAGRPEPFVARATCP